jgi:hypothetical protein
MSFATGRAHGFGWSKRVQDLAFTFRELLDLGGLQLQPLHEAGGDAGPRSLDVQCICRHNFGLVLQEGLRNAQQDTDPILHHQSCTSQGPAHRNRPQLKAKRIALLFKL